MMGVKRIIVLNIATFCFSVLFVRENTHRLRHQSFSEALGRETAAKPF